MSYRSLTPQVRTNRLALFLSKLGRYPSLLCSRYLTSVTKVLHSCPTINMLLADQATRLPPNLRLRAFRVRPVSQTHRDEFLTGCLKRPGRIRPVLARLRLRTNNDTVTNDPVLLHVTTRITHRARRVPARHSTLCHHFLST